jgi:DNA (cytosine-5)-methyltransferase 1
MNEQPTHLDLFSGIGGFALAAGWAGFETIGFCEIEPYCQAVLKKHWPQVPIHTDIRELRGGGKESIYLQGAFLASHSVIAGSEEAKMITAISGRKCCELLKSKGRLGHWRKCCWNHQYGTRPSAF